MKQFKTILIYGMFIFLLVSMSGFFLWFRVTSYMEMGLGFWRSLFMAITTK